MEIRKLTPDELPSALDLIWETFLQFEAPDYAAEGVQSFKAFLDDRSTIATLEFSGALDEGELLGVLAVNQGSRHICCFFCPRPAAKAGDRQKAVGIPARKQPGGMLHRAFLALCRPGVS